MNGSPMITELQKPVRVLVLGDLILDRYTWGNAERVSPEAPVLVLRADEREVRPGGAASVAMLLRHLEAKVTLAGVVGDDAGGRSLLKILNDEQVDQDLVCCVSGRPTTTKERFVGRAANRHPHQILRVDHETRESIDAETVSRLRDGILRHIAEHSVIIISDYAKGVCTPELLNAVIDAARDRHVPIVVDPARIEDYSRYRRASLVTPNRGEAELATGIRIDSPADALEAGRVLIEQASLDAAFITLDRDGIAVIGGADEESSQHVEPAVAREVYDITGAGDMVVAVTGLCQAAGWPLDETARIANAAAGLEIEQLGIAPVNWEQILERYAASGCHAARVARPKALRRAWSSGDRTADVHRHVHPASLAKWRNPMNKTLTGVIHGKTIELAEDPGIADGEKVEVTLRTKQLPGPPPGWFPGCTETAGGMMAEWWTEEDDRILEEIYQDRKRDTRPEIVE